MAQWPGCSPYCSQAEEGFQPCADTFSLFRRKEFYDIGVILPSWLPIVNKQYVAILEGTVTNNYTEGTEGPHMSYEDLPYTELRDKAFAVAKEHHDVGFFFDLYRHAPSMQDAQAEGGSLGDISGTIIDMIAAAEQTFE